MKCLPCNLAIHKKPPLKYNSISLCKTMIMSDWRRESRWNEWESNNYKKKTVSERIHYRKIKFLRTFRATYAPIDTRLWYSSCEKCRHTLTHMERSHPSKLVRIVVVWMWANACARSDFFTVAKKKKTKQIQLFVSRGSAFGIHSVRFTCVLRIYLLKMHKLSSPPRWWCEMISPSPRRRHVWSMSNINDI